MRKLIWLILSTWLLVGCATTSEEPVSTMSPSADATTAPDFAKEDDVTAVEEAQAESTAEPLVEAETEQPSKDTAQEDTDSLSGNFDIDAALVNVSKVLESAQGSGFVECTGNTFAAEAMDVGFGEEAFTSCQTGFGLVVVNEYPSDTHAAAASESYIDVVTALSERINLAVLSDGRTFVYIWGDGIAQLDVPSLASFLGFEYDQIQTGILE